MSLFWSDLIVYSVLVAVVLYVTKINHMWGVNRGVAKAKVDVRKDKDLKSKQAQLLWFLDKCAWFNNNTGFVASEDVLLDYKYKLERLRWQLPYLDRVPKPIELVGFFKLVYFVGSLAGILGIVLLGWFIFYGLFLSLLLPLAFKLFADSTIADEDMAIEQDFPDLYLLLYGRLVRGAYVRLAPTLDDFITSLDVMYGTGRHKAIRYFVVDMRNNIEIYGDDSIAITKLRERYRSAMVINFCNLAVQSLNGVNNSDKLLAFKVELSQKRMDNMKRRAEMLVAKGNRAILVVYVILAQFVVLSWASKFGGLSSIRGILGF